LIGRGGTFLPRVRAQARRASHAQAAEAFV